jgi:hypothetical protein
VTKKYLALGKLERHAWQQARHPPHGEAATLPAKLVRIATAKI